MLRSLLVITLGLLLAGELAALDLRGEWVIDVERTVAGAAALAGDGFTEEKREQIKAVATIFQSMKLTLVFEADRIRMTSKGLGDGMEAHPQELTIIKRETAENVLLLTTRQGEDEGLETLIVITQEVDGNLRVENESGEDPVFWLRRKTPEDDKAVDDQGAQQALLKAIEQMQVKEAAEEEEGAVEHEVEVVPERGAEEDLVPVEPGKP